LVLEDKVDFALGDPGESIPPGVRVEILRTCHRLLVVPTRDRLLRLDHPLHADQLRDRDWIVLAEYSLVRGRLNALLGHYAIAMEVDNWEVVKAYVSMGVGISVIPELCILPKDRKQLATIPLVPEFGQTYCCLVLRKKKVLHPGVLALIHTIDPTIAQRLAGR